jgi:glycosyltransferase involved in cell wall biosynthesis
MAKVVFYCNDEKENISIFEYYAQDITAIEALGHEVIVCTRYREIPLNFDYIFVWWWTYALVPVIFAKMIGAKSIVTGAFNFRFPKGFEGIDYFSRPLWQRFLISSAAKLADVNIFINDFEENDCKVFFDLKRTYISPCVVGEDYFNNSKEVEGDFLFNIAWSGKDNLVRKGIPELLDAIKILKSRGREVKLKLAGKKGDGFEWLQNKIETLGLSSNVELLGKITFEQKLNLLRKCILYVQPSHYEGFGLGIAEAMSSSCCVVTCDAGAVRSVVGEAGVYSNNRDSIDLADKIEMLLIDKKLRLKIQSDAYARALESFSPKSKIKLFSEIFN